MDDYIKNVRINDISQIKIRNILLVFFLLIFCFSDFITIFFKFANYLDEIVAIFLLSYFLFDVFFRKKKIEKDIFVWLLIVASIALLGFIGNIVFSYQKNLFAVFLDVLATFKYLFIYLGARAILKNSRHDLTSVKSMLWNICSVYIFLLSFLALVNLFFDIGMSNEVRYGIKNFCFIFDIPGILINHCIICALIFIYKKDLNLKTIFRLVLCIFVMISTLKTRGFILSAALAILLFYNKNSFLKINFHGLFIIAIILVLIGLPQFEYYFVSNTGPRYLFFKNSFILANKYYLFGTGFSTFGSGAAAQYYSPLYYELGFDLIYGMSPDLNLFLNDTFWPSILGQFGYVGFILYFILLCLFSKKIFTENKSYLFMIILFLLNGWFSSIQSAFITSIYFCSSLFLCLIFSFDRAEKRE